MPRVGTLVEATTAQTAIVALAIAEVDSVLIRSFPALGSIVIVSSQSALSGGQITSIDAAGDPVKVSYRVTG